MDPVYLPVLMMKDCRWDPRLERDTWSKDPTEYQKDKRTLYPECTNGTCPEN